MAQTTHDAALNTPAEHALMARISRYFARAIKALPDEDQVAALAASSDILTVIETLARQSAQESPEYAVRLRGAAARQRLLQEEGGVIGPAQVAELLGISRQAVGQRRAAGRLLGIPGAGDYQYPLWQFTGQDVLPGLAEVLLVDIAGRGLAKMGIVSRLASGAYEIAQRWSWAFYHHPDRPDGLQYRSRHNPRLLCAAFFDRTEKLLSVETYGSLPEHLGETGFYRLLERYKIGLIWGPALSWPSGHRVRAVDTQLISRADAVMLRTHPRPQVGQSATDYI